MANRYVQSVFRKTLFMTGIDCARKSVYLHPVHLWEALLDDPSSGHDDTLCLPHFFHRKDFPLTYPHTPARGSVYQPLKLENSYYSWPYPESADRNEPGSGVARQACYSLSKMSFSFEAVPPTSTRNGAAVPFSPCHRRFPPFSIHYPSDRELAFSHPPVCDYLCVDLFTFCI